MNPSETTAWEKMLAGVEQALARVEELVGKPEEADSPLARPASWEEKLSRLDVLCLQLRERVGQANQAAEATEAVWAGHEAALRQWLQHTPAYGLGTVALATQTQDKPCGKTMDREGEALAEPEHQNPQDLPSQFA